MNIGRIAVLGLIGGAVVIAAAQMPEIKRYLKIKSM
jgi:uncharacterized protein DUF6893